MAIGKSRIFSFFPILLAPFPILALSISATLATLSLLTLTNYAHKTSVQATLRGMAAAQESHFAMYGFYTACTSVRECKLALDGIPFKPAGNVDITVVVKNEGRDFAIMAIHGDKVTTGCWDSRNGGLQEDCSKAGF